MAWIVDGNDDEVIVKEIAFYAQDNTGNVRYLGEHPGEDETKEELEGVDFIWLSNFGRITYLRA